MSRHRSVLVLAIVASAAMVFASPLLAGPLRKEQVSAKAKWLVHADVKAFLASKTGSFVLEELKKKGLELMLDNIREAFAFDVTKDLKSLTVYGSTFEKHAAIILLHATMDRDRLTEVLKGNETYRELKYAGHTVHQWTDNPQSPSPGPTRFGVFHADDLAVVTEDVRLLQQALDVLDKKADSLAARRAAKSPASESGKPFLTAYVAELPPIGEGKPEGVILGKLASGHLAAGESKERLRVHVTLTAKTARTATNLRKIAEGFLALIDLASPEQAGGTPAASKDRAVIGDMVVPAEVIAVLKDITVTAKGRTVRVDADVSVASATALLRRIIGQDEAEKTEAEGAGTQAEPAKTEAAEK